MDGERLKIYCSRGNSRAADASFSLEIPEKMFFFCKVPEEEKNALHNR